jgi:hypothetical protein
MVPRPNTQFACLIVFADARDSAHFVEAAAIDQSIDALANGKTALIVLPLDLVGAAHLLCKGFAPRKFVQFGLPVHRLLPWSCAATQAAVSSFCCAE